MPPAVTVTRVGGEGFGVTGPTADVEPLDGQGDGGDMGGFFHDGGVDGEFGEGGVNGVENFGLSGGAPGCGDFHVAFVGGGQVLLELVEDGFGFPDEHAGVPGEAGIGEVMLSEVCFGFFFEGFDMKDTAEVDSSERFAALDVAEASGGVGGGDAEGEEKFRMLLRRRRRRYGGRLGRHL